MMHVNPHAERCRNGYRGPVRMGLREVRERRLLSQAELASAARVSNKTIVGIESGRVRPHPSTLRKLAAALDVEPAELAEHLRRPTADEGC